MVELSFVLSFSNGSSWSWSEDIKWQNVVTEIIIYKKSSN